MPIDLSMKKNCNGDMVKQSLYNIIVQSGGVPVNEQEEDIEDGIGEDEIEVPKSEFIDEDDGGDDGGDGGGDNSNNADSGTDKLQFKHHDLKLAIPKDKTSPYSNDWIDITPETNLGDANFTDYDIIGFSIGDEPIHIIEPAYEE